MRTRKQYKFAVDSKIRDFPKSIQHLLQIYVQMNRKTQTPWLWIRFPCSVQRTCSSLKVTRWHYGENDFKFLSWKPCKGNPHLINICTSSFFIYRFTLYAINLNSSLRAGRTGYGFFCAPPRSNRGCGHTFSCPVCLLFARVAAATWRCWPHTSV
jgi:hypothetical protein